MTPREVRALAERAQERDRRADARAGVVASVIANVNRDSRQRPQPYQASDFFGSLERVEPSAESIEAGFEAWAAMMGAKPG